MRFTPHRLEAVRAVVPATKCSIKRSCLYLLSRLLRIGPMITPKIGYLGQTLYFNPKPGSLISIKIRSTIFKKPYYHIPDNERWFSNGINDSSDSIEYRIRFFTELAEGNLQFETTPCICGNEEFDIITTVDRHKIQQGMVICTICGLLINNPRLDQKSYNYYYSSCIYRSKEASFEDEPSAGSYFGQIMRDLNAHDPDIQKRNSVLDIGSNKGFTLSGFKEAGWQSAGLEPYESGVKICQAIRTILVLSPSQHRQSELLAIETEEEWQAAVEVMDWDDRVRFGSAVCA